MSATKIWRLSSKRFGPAKPGILKCAPFSYAAKPAHGPMPSSSCSPIRSSNIWRRVGAPWISPWKKASTPSRRSVSWKCRPRMPPAITASPHLVTPSRNYCTVPTSSSQRPSPSLVPACPRRKNSSQNGLCSKFSPLTCFLRFVLGGEDGLQVALALGHRGDNLNRALDDTLDLGQGLLNTIFSVANVLVACTPYHVGILHALVPGGVLAEDGTRWVP